MNGQTIKFPVVTTDTLLKQGADFQTINQLLKQNKIVRIKRGFYMSSEAIKNPHQAAFEAFPNAMYCLLSSAYLFGYLTNEPELVYIAASKKESRKKYKSKVLPLKSMTRDDKYYDLGKSQITIKDKVLNTTDRERTILDCIRHSDLIGPDAYGQVLLGYIQDPNKNIEHLVDYAKQMRLIAKVLLIFKPWLKHDLLDQVATV